MFTQLQCIVYYISFIYAQCHEDTLRYHSYTTHKSLILLTNNDIVVHYFTCLYLFHYLYTLVYSQNITSTIIVTVSFYCWYTLSSHLTDIWQQLILMLV